MRKYLRALYSFAIILICSLVMFGCGVKIEDVTVKSGTIDRTIAKNTTLDTDNFEAIVKYSDDTKRVITSEDVVFGTIDTTTTGQKDLEVKFEDHTFYIKITVVETASDIATVTMFNSSLVTDYKTNSGLQENKEEEFVLREEPYYVGDDNLFHFRINAKGIDGAGNIVNNLSNVRTEVNVELIEGNENNPVYIPLTDEQVASYMTINTENTTIDFNDDTAVNKLFRITVNAVNYDEAYFDYAPSFTITVKVIDAYNVYDATDFSVLDNSGANGWNELKSTQLQNISNNINGIVLHNDIHITNDDLPSGVFLNAQEAKAIDASITNQTIEGSLKDHDDIQLYKRELKENQEFNFVGNCFQVDYSEVAKCVVQRGNKTGIKTSDDGNEQAIVIHSSFMKFYPYEYLDANNNPTRNVFPTVNIANVAFKGNGKRSEKSINSGGLILMKTRGTIFTADNTLFQDCNIGYYFENAFENLEEWFNADLDKSYFEIKNSKGFNCYTSSLYFFGAKEVLIENCEYKRNGGPVMIVDHVENENDGSGGYPTTINTINCDFESYVTGAEPWFATHGASSLMSAIVSMDGLYKAAVQPSDEVKVPTILVQDGGVSNLINLVCISKSGSASGPTASRTRNRVTMFENREDYLAQQENGDKSYGLVFEGNGLVDKAMASANADVTKTFNYLESTSTGDYIGTDFMIGVQPEGEFYLGDFVNLYLFNGMGCIMGLYR